MKLIGAGPKLRWVNGRGERHVLLTFDNGTQVEVEDHRVIGELASCARGWTRADELGENYLPRLTPEELEDHKEKRKQESKE